MYSGEYKRKLTTAEKAIEPIPGECTIVHGMATGEPPALLGAVADRARTGGFKKVRIYTLFPMAHASKTVLDPALSDVIYPHSWFVSASDRNLVRVGLNEFVPNEFHEVPRIVKEMSIDAVLTTVSSHCCSMASLYCLRIKLSGAFPLRKPGIETLLRTSLTACS